MKFEVAVDFTASAYVEVHAQTEADAVGFVKQLFEQYDVRQLVDGDASCKFELAETVTDPVICWVEEDKPKQPVKPAKRKARIASK